MKALVRENRRKEEQEQIEDEEREEIVTQLLSLKAPGRKRGMKRD